MNIRDIRYRYELEREFAAVYSGGRLRGHHAVDPSGHLVLLRPNADLPDERWRWACEADLEAAAAAAEGRGPELVGGKGGPLRPPAPLEQQPLESTEGQQLAAEAFAEGAERAELAPADVASIPPELANKVVNKAESPIGEASIVTISYASPEEGGASSATVAATATIKPAMFAQDPSGRPFVIYPDGEEG